MVSDALMLTCRTALVAAALLSAVGVQPAAAWCGGSAIPECTAYCEDENCAAHECCAQLGHIKLLCPPSGSEWQEVPCDPNYHRTNLPGLCLSIRATVGEPDVPLDLNCLQPASGGTRCGSVRDRTGAGCANRLPARDFCHDTQGPSRRDQPVARGGADPAGSGSLGRDRRKPGGCPSSGVAPPRT